MTNLTDKTKTNDEIYNFTENDAIKIDEAISNSTPTYKEYVALLTQSGGNAPTAVVLSNTLGGVPVWTKNNIGVYYLILIGAFPVDKTFYTKMIHGSSVDSLICEMYTVSDDTMGISCSQNTGGVSRGVDDVLSKIPISIKVYD